MVGGLSVLVLGEDVLQHLLYRLPKHYSYSVKDYTELRRTIQDNTWLWRTLHYHTEFWTIEEYTELGRTLQNYKGISLILICERKGGWASGQNWTFSKNSMYYEPFVCRSHFYETFSWSFVVFMPLNALIYWPWHIFSRNIEESFQNIAMKVW